MQIPSSIWYIVMVSIVWLGLNKMWKERTTNNAFSLSKIFHQLRPCLLMYHTNKYKRVQPVPGSKMVVKSRSVKMCQKKCEKRAGDGVRHFSRRHRPLSQVSRVLFSLSSFYYVPTILSESVGQAKKGSTVKPLLSDSYGTFLNVC